MFTFKSLMAKLLAGFLLVCLIGLVSSGITFFLVRGMNQIRWRTPTFRCCSAWRT